MHLRVQVGNLLIMQGWTNTYTKINLVAQVYTIKYTDQCMNYDLPLCVASIIVEASWLNVCISSIRSQAEATLFEESHHPQQVVITLVYDIQN